MLYKVGIDRTTLVEPVIVEKWSWEVIEKSWNFVIRSLWEPCVMIVFYIDVSSLTYELSMVAT